jgi:hypothetical protein
LEENWIGIDEVKEASGAAGRILDIPVGSCGNWVLGHLPIRIPFDLNNFKVVGKIILESKNLVTLRCGRSCTVTAR